MTSASDEIFWEGFHYQPLSETDSVLANRLADVFCASFAEAAALRCPNRDAINAELELGTGTHANGDRAIRLGFPFAGSRQQSEWDGTPEDAEAFVKDSARAVAESLSVDPHEDDDWRLRFG